MNTVSHEQKDITLIIYIVSENDLSEESDKLLDSLSTISPGNNVNLIVFIDDLSYPRLYRIDGGLNLIRKYPELNSLTPIFLHNVLEDIYRLYPAKEKGIVFWSHGSGWISTENIGTRSFGSDNNMVINIDELSSSLPVLYDYIIFDACYMASIEVAAEFCTKSSYIVGAPNIVPMDGIICKESIELLIDNTSIVDKLSGICDLYVFNHCDYKQPISVGIINVDGIQLLMEYISNHRFDIQTLGGMDKIPGYSFRDFKIFYDARFVFEKLGVPGEIIDRTLRYSLNNNYSVNDYGVSVFLPAEYNYIYWESYKENFWNRSTSWLLKMAPSYNAY